MRLSRPCRAAPLPPPDPARRPRTTPPATTWRWGVPLRPPPPPRHGHGFPDPETLKPGEKLIVHTPVEMKYYPEEPHRDELTLRKGAEFVVFRPPDDEHPAACLLEAAGIVWGWIPLHNLARVP